jgi:hypothetical protein
VTEPRRLIGWLLLVAGLAVGCVGFARGDYWAGISTGNLGPCPSFDFDINVDGDKIGGTATSEYDFGTVLWEVRGQIGAERRVTIQTKTGDPRVPQQTLVWTGTYNVVLWDIALTPDARCPAARVARLQRK